MFENLTDGQLEILILIVANHCSIPNKQRKHPFESKIENEIRIQLTIESLSRMGRN